MPATPPADPGELHVRAESYEQVEKGHIEARGLVDLNLAGMRIQADKADIYEVTHPDGKQGHRLVAEGNVVFIRGEERLAGEKLEMDDTGHGFLTNASGFVEPGVFVEGRRVERVDDRTYKVEGGHFTSCSQPNPRWGFQSSSAEIDVDDKVKATNAIFRLKGIPIFYLPYMIYPIRHDRPLDRVPVPALRLLLVRAATTSGDGLLLGDGPQRRPDLLRRLLVEDRLRLRPRAALRGAVALARELPHLRVRREGRLRSRLRPRLERAAGAAGEA